MVNLKSAEITHFMLWPNQFQKIRQIKSWYCRIDLTNPLKSYLSHHSSSRVGSSPYSRKNRPVFAFRISILDFQLHEFSLQAEEGARLLKNLLNPRLLRQGLSNLDLDVIRWNILVSFSLLTSSYLPSKWPARWKIIEKKYLYYINY